MNRNIFRLVFNRKHNTYVGAPETACGQHKASTRTTTGGRRTVLQFFRFSAVAALAGTASATSADGLSLPSGYVFALDNGSGSTNGSYTIPDTFETCLKNKATKSARERALGWTALFFMVVMIIMLARSV